MAENDVIPGQDGQPARVTVRPAGPKSDPFADFPDAPPARASGDGAVGTKAADPWDSFPDQPVEPKKRREVSTGEAATRGFESGAALGAGPAILGTMEAGVAGGEAKKVEPELSASDMLLGLARMGYEKLRGGDTATNAYNERRQAEVESNAAASEQHPVAYTAGQVAGAITTPAAGMAKGGLTVGGRILAGTKAGAVGGGLYGAGEAISEGKGLADVGIEGAKGAGTGAAFGTVGAGVVEGARGLGGKVWQLIRGDRPEAIESTAARRVAGVLQSDRERRGAPKFTPEETAAANAAGTPRILADLGDERTRAELRRAANLSAEGRDALEEPLTGRFRTQAPRIAGFIRNRTGAHDAGADREAIQALARRENRARYTPAYRSGDRSIWSPEVERLTGSPAVQDAIRGAVERGRNRAIADGYGGFNPGVTVTPDGRLIFNRGRNGVQTYPNIQFWDYVQRELRDAEGQAIRAGANEQGGAIGAIRGQLNAELDRLVPQFGQARRTAAGFFDADNALEAGQAAVMRNFKLGDMRRALQQMTPTERLLFARGFAAELADRIEQTGDGRNVLDSIFLNNNPARQKIEVALGPQFSREFEAVLRVEQFAEQTRRSLGNSTTARQLHEMSGHGAGTAVATVDAIKEHGANPYHILGAMFGLRALGQRAQHIDERVAQRIGEMLASDDPAILRRAMQMIASRPVLMDALRQATSGAAITGAHDIGPSRAAAGVGAAGQYLIGRERDRHQGNADSLTDQLAQ